MRLIILLLLFVFASEVLSCSAPKGGKKYDALINIEGPNSKGIYSLSVPMKLDGYKFLPTVELSYTKLHEHGYKIAELAEPLNLEVRDDFLVSSFTVPKEEGYKAYVRVFLTPNRGGMCGVYANSKLLSAE